MKHTLSGATPSEIVWDAALRGTATTDDGVPITVAGPTGWSPELLLVTAAAASIMTHFLELAADAGVEVLGYVSRQALAPTASDEPKVEISVCIVLTSARAAEQARSMLDIARTGAAVIRVLQRPPAIDMHLNVVREPERRTGQPFRSSSC